MKMLMLAYLRDDMRSDPGDIGVFRITRLVSSYISANGRSRGSGIRSCIASYVACPFRSINDPTPIRNALRFFDRGGRLAGPGVAPPWGGVSEYNAIEAAETEARDAGRTASFTKAASLSESFKLFP